MKFKLILFLASILFLSCSKDDDNDSCEIQIWRMNLTDGVYTVSYGPDENNTTTVEVNEETYNYYTDITEDQDPDDCWEGMK